MKRLHRGGNSADRRRYRRALLTAKLAQHPEGAEVKIMTDAYGQRYKGTTATVLNQNNKMLVVRAYRRKSPMVVDPFHVEQKAA